MTLPGVSATGIVSADMITIRGIPLTTSGTNIALGTNTQRATSGAGVGNIAIGSDVGTLTGFIGSNNIVMGATAGSKIRLSSNNLMLGSSAGNQATGAANILMGYKVGYTLIGGVQIRLLGFWRASILETIPVPVIIF